MNISVRTLTLIVISTLIGGLVLGWLFFGGSTETSAHEHIKSSDNQVWTCSMHPQIRQNEPGNCPICGMDLIPLEGDGDEAIDAMAVSMSPTAMQLANVSTGVIGVDNVVKTIRLNGKVQEDERLVYSQNSHFPGRVERLIVNFTGEYVSKGSTIAYLYSPELVTAQEELFEAYKIRESQPNLFQAAIGKLKNWKLLASQIDQIISTRKIKEEFPVRADQSGYVISKKVNLGDYVKRGQVLYEIANLSQVWLLFDVYESDLPWVNAGDSIRFTISSLPGENFKGKIDYIDPVINQKTRVAQARVVVKNGDQKLKPEMFVSGEVKANLLKSGGQLVVPKSAVMWTGKRSVVYVRLKSDMGIHFKMREITLGPALGDAYVVEEGLEPGEEIAINGTFSIDAAAQLAGKPSMMSPGGRPVSVHDHGVIKMSGSSDQNQNNEVDPVVISQKAKESLQPLYTEYLKLKDALTNDNFEQAQQAAKDFKATVEKLNISAFTDRYQSWFDNSGDLKNALEHIQHLQTIAELRKMFLEVSERLIALAEVYRPMDQTLYVQFCPMVDNNKGAAWLSTEEEIRNPYFGASMLTCGEVKSTIQ